MARLYPKPLLTCPGCGRKRKHHARGYCRSCYQKSFMREYMRRRRRGEGGRVTECAGCGGHRVYYALGLCEECYRRRRKGHLTST